MAQFGDTLQKGLGYGLGTAALLEGLRSPGGLLHNYAALQQLRTDPTVQEAAINSPFQAGFLGVGGGRVPYRDIGPPGEPSQSGERFVANFPPPNQRSLAQQVLARGQLGLLKQPESANQAARASLNVPLAPEEIVDQYTRAYNAAQEAGYGDAPPQFSVGPYGGVSVTRPSTLSEMLPYFSGLIPPQIPQAQPSAQPPARPPTPAGRPKPQPQPEQPPTPKPNQEGFLAPEQIDPNRPLADQFAQPEAGGAAYPSPAFVEGEQPQPSPVRPQRMPIPATPQAQPQVQRLPRPAPGVSVSERVSPTATVRLTQPGTSQLQADFLENLSQSVTGLPYSQGKRDLRFRQAVGEIEGTAKGIASSFAKRYEALPTEIRDRVAIAGNALAAIEVIKRMQQRLGPQFYNLVGAGVGRAREFARQVPEPLARGIEGVTNKLGGRATEVDYEKLRTSLSALRSAAFILGGRALTGTELSIFDNIFPHTDERAAAFQVKFPLAEQFVKNLTSWNIELSYLPAAQADAVLRSRISTYADVAERAPIVGSRVIRPATGAVK